MAKSELYINIELKSPKPLFKAILFFFVFTKLSKVEKIWDIAFKFCFNVDVSNMDIK